MHKVRKYLQIGEPACLFCFPQGNKNGGGHDTRRRRLSVAPSGNCGVPGKIPGHRRTPYGSQLADTNVLVRSSFRVSGLLVVMKSIPHAMQVIMSCTVSTVHTFVTMPLACASLTHPGLPE